MYLLYLTIFIMFFQPAAVWPAWEAYQPLRNSAILALLAYMFAPKRSTAPFFAEKVNRFFLAFVIMQVLSASAVWISGGIDIFNLWLRMGLVYFLITQSVDNEDKVKGIAAAIVLAIVYLSYYSISSFVVGYLPGMRAGGFGWYENSSDIAIILVTAIPLALLVANTAKAMPTRILFMAIAGMFAFNILFTGSRNGMLGLLTVGALSIYFSERVPKLIRTLLFAGLIVGVFTVGMASILGRSDLAGTGLSGDDSSENRIEQWKTGLSMLKHHPIFGIGPGEFTTYVKDYGGVRGLEPHNTLLQVFAESGLLGGISFSLLVFYPFVYLKKLFKSEKDTKNAVSVMFYKLICASLAGFWACAFFSNRYQSYILYVLIALSVAVKQNLLKFETQGDIK